MAGLEPTSSCIPSRRASQTAPHPDEKLGHQSGWPDSNRRPLASEASALARLRHIPCSDLRCGVMIFRIHRLGRRKTPSSLGSQEGASHHKNAVFSCYLRPRPRCGASAHRRRRSRRGHIRGVRLARQADLERGGDPVIVHLRVHDHHSLGGVESVYFEHCMLSSEPSKKVTIVRRRPRGDTRPRSGTWPRRGTRCWSTAGPR